MSAIYEQMLQDLHVDEELLNLIASRVPALDATETRDPKGIGIELLHFLEREPEFAREAAEATTLSPAVREVIAQNLAREFLSRGQGFPPVPGMPKASAALDLPAPDSGSNLDAIPSEYRLIFECQTEPLAAEPLGEATGRIPPERR